MFDSASMWFILGVALLVVEAIHTGVLAVFFALGAWVTAILMWLGVVESAPAQLAVFLIVSLVSLVTLRKQLRTWLTGLRHPARNDEALDDFVGKLATVVQDIDASRNTGTVEFRGTHWPARAASVIPKGEVVRIVSRENLTLSVQPSKEA